jgi:zinc protease
MTGNEGKQMTAMRAYRRAVTSMLALALTLPAALAGQQTPPAPGPAKDITLPAPYTFTLDNGLEVQLLEYGGVPKAAVQLVVRVGNVDEAADEVWLADLVGDLMAEGTGTRTAEQIATEAASMGGSLNVSVSSDETTIGGDALAEFAPMMIALVADVARNPAFPATDLARLKADQVRSLAIAKSRPQALANERFAAALYPDHPYGVVFPTEAMIQSYTLEQLRAFHAEHFHAARARLYVIGQFDRAAVERAVRTAFAGWSAGTASAPALADAHANTNGQPVIHIIDRPGAVQSSMYIGLPVIDPTDPDYVPLQVTNTLLGGAFASRITRNIREDKGYTYSPFSFVSSRYRSAYWAEVADVTTGVTGASIEEIFKEIDRLTQEPPPADELQSIQNYLAGTFTLSSSSRGGLLGQLRMLDLHGLPRSYFTNYVRNVYAVTPAEVQRVMREYLPKDEMVIVIVGDRSQIEQQVAAYGRVITD